MSSAVPQFDDNQTLSPDSFTSAYRLKGERSTVRRCSHEPAVNTCPDCYDALAREVEALRAENNRISTDNGALESGYEQLERQLAECQEKLRKYEP